MKEIHHEDNKHLDAVNRILAEAEELGLANDFLKYGDAPVRLSIRENLPNNI